MSELLLPGSASHRHRGNSDLSALQEPLPLRHAVQPGAPHALVLRVRVLPAAGKAPQRRLEVRATGKRHTAVLPSLFISLQMSQHRAQKSRNGLICIGHEQNPHDHLRIKTFYVLKEDGRKIYLCILKIHLACVVVWQIRFSYTTSYFFISLLLHGMKQGHFCYHIFNIITSIKWYNISPASLFNKNKTKIRGLWCY